MSAKNKDANFILLKCTTLHNILLHVVPQTNVCRIEMNNSEGINMRGKKLHFFSFARKKKV